MRGSRRERGRERIPGGAERETEREKKSRAHLNWGSCPPETGLQLMNSEIMT